MNVAVNLARIVALVCASVMCVSVVRLLDALASETKTREAVTKEIPGVLHREAELIRRDVRVELQATRTTLDGRLASIESTADARLSLIQADADRHAASVSGEAAQLLARYRRVPDELAWATSTIWDCTSNPDCVENRYVSVSRAVEASAKSVQIALPKIVQSTERVSGAVEKTLPQLVEQSAGVAANLNRITKPRWYDRLLSGAITAGVLAVK